MPASVASAPVRHTPNKTTPTRNVKKAGTAATKKPQTNGAVNGATNGASHPQMSPYTIMASRIANRVAEMAENMTFVEREKPQPQNGAVQPQPAPRKPPRKLEMRIPNSGASPTNITFSAPFLDNTLSKLLTLQNRMLTVSNDIAACEDVDEKTKQEQFAQSAELSRIIALICAEKARQGA
ncbi:hypothetical protein COCC4DRAFT_171179 [Bipolaris maydis ATCC 48331]|uniref:Uncharacterized protein n=2 Tax=Cochliobolus heterostrophus TaxID=5016 RepID=M2UF02_COCH5|nr:uncharacterized protein COCC4DRAFT_171179 [Bipolaris maydis ATCC 48331]EMD97099.1 hypothetical protein COCHEDRAFT_1124170 [Bipolaris maydis C5]KAH7551522.1 hypothetical protein BM1_09838 [Bipolaris maydis]ENI04435.1 hypothetical protein COCC4DRAFT_171179 [Bipolaris maydis ATCC 48331]KAJ5029561.1 hypothetical protein J3E73DRAFT_379427 [Bipolaris maydis]KAJ5061696.1 hypothetical protein J3E74DRAFT_473434 [Bipolaris maydis]